MYKKNIPVDLIVRKELKDSLLKRYSNINKVLITDDLFKEKQSWLKACCKDTHTIIHSAWVSDPGENIQSYENIEAMIGTLNLAKAASETGVKKFVGLGTCYEYEESDEPLTIDSELTPKTLYGSAKASTFLTLTQFFKLSGIQFLWPRIFFLYGEGEPDRRLIPHVRKKLSLREEIELSSGEQIRDYMDVTEASEKIVSFSLDAKEGPINICSGKAISIRELVENIAEEYHGKHLLRFGKKPLKEGETKSIVGVPS